MGWKMLASKKAGIFYLIFSQKMGINILGGPLRKSSLCSLHIISKNIKM